MVVAAHFQGIDSRADSGGGQQPSQVVRAQDTLLKVLSRQLNEKLLYVVVVQERQARAEKSIKNGTGDTGQKNFESDGKGGQEIVTWELQYLYETVGCIFTKAVSVQSQVP